MKKGFFGKNSEFMNIEVPNNFPIAFKIDYDTQYVYRDALNK